MALRQGGGAYFDLDWVDEDAFRTNPAPNLACVDNFYVQVLLPGQHRPLGPRVLVYGQLCDPKRRRAGREGEPIYELRPFQPTVARNDSAPNGSLLVYTALAAMRQEHLDRRPGLRPALLALDNGGHGPA